LLIIVFLSIPVESLAWTLVDTQTNFNDGVGHTSLAAPAMNVSSGSLIVVTLAWAQTSTPSTLTADCTNCGTDTFTQATNVNSTSDGYHLAVFYKCGATANASYTITGHNSGSFTFSRIIVEQFTGGDTGTCFDKTTGQRQTAPGTSTDAVTSGSTAATTTNGQLIHGATVNVGSATTITQGTGYTSGTLNYHGVSTEYKTQSSAGAVAATFTTDSNPATAQYTIVSTYKALVSSRRVMPMVLQ